MDRPCFLVVDREHANSISTRKLVIETAKFNVITAYSAGEALSLLKRFPAVSGVVMDALMEEMSCEELVHGLKKICPGLIVIVITAGKAHDCKSADHLLESFSPGPLLELLRTLNPESAKEIEATNENLESRDDPKR